MDNAKVKVSVLPSDKAAAAFKELEKNAGHLQYLLLKKINIKPMPRIAFAIDHGYENAAKVEKDLMEASEKSPGRVLSSPSVVPAVLLLSLSVLADFLSNA